MYVLDLFLYPLGQGLHVGHHKGYKVTDIYARSILFKNFNALHPIVWDSFGLPAEQYSLQTGNHLATFIYENIDVFLQQIQT